MSFIVSGCILVWSFWIPFQALRSETGGRPDLEQRVEIRQLNAEQVRHEATLLDKQLMRQIRENRLSRNRDKPTSDESRQWLEHRVSNIRRKIRKLGNPAKGTIEWDNKRHLIQSLEDTPQS